MEVSTRYFDQHFAAINRQFTAIDKKIGLAATKQELKETRKEIREVEKRLKKYSDDNTDKLGRVINSALQELEGRLDGRFKELREMDIRSQMLTLQRRVEKIEAQMFGKNY